MRATHGFLGGRLGKLVDLAVIVRVLVEIHAGEREVAAFRQTRKEGVSWHPWQRPPVPSTPRTTHTVVTGAHVMLHMSCMRLAMFGTCPPCAS